MCKDLSSIQEDADASANNSGEHQVIARCENGDYLVIALHKWVAGFRDMFEFVENVSPDAYLEFEVG